MITIGWSKSNNQTCLSRQTTSRTYIITRPGLAGQSHHQRIYHHSTFHIMTKAFHSFSLFLPLFFCCMPNSFLYGFLSFSPFHFLIHLLWSQASWRLLLDYLTGEIPPIVRSSFVSSSTFLSFLSSPLIYSP